MVMDIATNQDLRSLEEEGDVMDQMEDLIYVRCVKDLVISVHCGACY